MAFPSFICIQQLQWAQRFQCSRFKLLAQVDLFYDYVLQSPHF